MTSSREATEQDIAIILPMMKDFYEHERLPFDESRQVKLLTLLIDTPGYGRCLLLESDGAIAGYLILGFGFSVEFGGRDALLDELYVRPGFRGKGIGTAAIDIATELCRSERMEAIHLEADHQNHGAHELYLRMGFKDHPRHLMTRWLK